MLSKPCTSPDDDKMTYRGIMMKRFGNILKDRKIQTITNNLEKITNGITQR